MINRPVGPPPLPGLVPSVCPRCRRPSATALMLRAKGKTFNQVPTKLGEPGDCWAPIVLEAISPFDPVSITAFVDCALRRVALIGAPTLPTPAPASDPAAS